MEARRKKHEKLAANEIHGAYYSARMVSSPSKVDQIIKKLDGTEINAVVIDVKDDSGNITFAVKNELANQIGAVTSQIWNVSEMINQFHDADIYVIGRVVAFRDAVLAVKQPSFAIQNSDGSVFYDRAKDTWLNPYEEKCWEYILGIASEAADVGFDEIQFDYMRFSTEAKQGKVSFGENADSVTKDEIITRFVETAVTTLHQHGVLVSADVFGTIITSEIDAMTVGQDYVELSRYLDFICPMIYPSHYADGCYGIDVPDLKPYQLILGALSDSAECLTSIGENEHRAVVRPWLQDFTASWKKVYQNYGLEQVEEQIRGVYDSGYVQWLLWNSSGRYSAIGK